MSKITNLIFKNQPHYITSKFGIRNTISTAAGITSNNHTGTDYGTCSQKLPQYAIEDGYIMDAARAADGANYVWVIYPGAKLAMLHYHLDTIAVKTGQKVKVGDLLGYTGMTGKATGIHLHLGIKPLSGVKNLNAVTYAVLNGIPYVDPEKVNYSEQANSSFFPAKGYFAKGDTAPQVGKVAEFMRRVFPAYTDKKALGNTLGPYLTASIKEFQRRTGLKADGNINQSTVDMLKKHGFKE